MSAGYLPPPPRTDAERGALVTANLRLVRWAVARFLKGRPHLRHLEDDLIGEGVLGLLRAAELFDPAKGAFTTIAYYWALQKVRRYAANNDAGAVRVPVGVERKERARLCKRGRALSLSRSRPGEAPPSALLAGRDDDHAERDDDDRRRRQALGEALRCLPPRWRAVLELRYGLDGGEALTLKGAGERLGVSRERVRQIEAKALERLGRCGGLAEVAEA